MVVCLAILIGSVTASIYFYNQYKQAQLLLKNPTEAAKIETSALLAKIKLLMDLPTGEDPTVATIVDVSKLKDQAFFSKAKNGDKILLYVKTKKAILYRPAENKIIDVAPLNIPETTPTGTQSQKTEVLPSSAVKKTVSPTVKPSTAVTPKVTEDVTAEPSISVNVPE